jgi:hypothetical protein
VPRASAPRSTPPASNVVPLSPKTDREL